MSDAPHLIGLPLTYHAQQPPTEDHYEDAVHKFSIGPTIRSQFGSIPHFINNFSSAARGMSGSGYIWLITDNNGYLAIQPTFAAGTLLVRSRTCTEDPAGQYEVLHEGRPRESPQPTHLNSGLGSTPTSPTSGMSQGPGPLHPSSPVRTLHSSSVQRVHLDGAVSLFDKKPLDQAFGPSAARRQLADRIYPLFCVSIHEHCWLLDHGVWGKEKYMKEFWNVLNWNKVEERYASFRAKNAGPQPLRM
jgi:Fe-Mn family superoxide dismutase